MQGSRLYHFRSVSHGITKTIATRETAMRTTAGYRLLQNRWLFHSSNFCPEKASNKWPSIQSPNESEEARKFKDIVEMENRALPETGGLKSKPESTTTNGSPSPENFSQRILTASKVAVSKATHSAANLLSLAASKTTESAKILASKASESALSMGHTISERAKTAAVSTSESIQSKTAAFLQSLGPRLVSFVRSSTMFVIQRFQSTLQVAVNGLVTRVRTRVIRPIREYIDSTGGGVVRSLWWWSLAAVGVYGIATTVPKELIRVAFKEKRVNEEDGLSSKAEK